MTDRTRLRIEISLLAVVFGGGAGWGSFQFELSALSKKVDRIDDRVTAIYCSGIPEAQKAACR